MGPSVCPPLPLGAGGTPRAVDKLSDFFTKTEGSWDTGYRGHAHTSPGSPQLQNLQSPGPLLPQLVCIGFAMNLGGKSMSAHTPERPPEPRVMGEVDKPPWGLQRPGGRPPSQSTQEPLPLASPPPPPLPHLRPGTTGLNPADHLPCAFARSQIGRASCRERVSSPV